MVETHTISDESAFSDLVTDTLDSFDDEAASDLWTIWRSHLKGSPLTSSQLLLLVDEWIATENIGRRRPILVATIEYDDPEKGAVLFDEVRTLDISVLENGVWGSPQFDHSDLVEPVDISDSNDYIDEPGMIWIPRSKMTAIE